MSLFVLDRLPSMGAKVELLCEDHVGTFTLPFLCQWTDEGGWTNAATRESAVFDVLGWRTPEEVEVARRRRAGR